MVEPNPESDDGSFIPDASETDRLRSLCAQTHHYPDGLKKGNSCMSVTGSNKAETENSVESCKTSADWLKPYHFKPGQSGNPGGRPKKKPITELYEQILVNPEHLQAIEAAIVKALKRGQMAMVLLLREMAERVEGKVAQPVDGDLNVTTLSLSERMQKARQRAGANEIRGIQ